MNVAPNLAMDRDTVRSPLHALYGAHRGARITMLQNAGWSGAYFLDETGALVKHIEKFLRTGETTPDSKILMAAENSVEAPKLKRKGGHG